MATTEILCIRTEALRANLDKILGHLNAVPDRRINLRALQDDVSAMQVAMGKARKAIGHGKAEVEYDPEQKETFESLQDALRELNTLESTLKRVEGVIASMKQECFRVQDMQIGTEIAKVLETRATPYLNTLEELRETLTLPAPTFQEGWEAFRTTAEQIGQPIFAEYIEFLGGLALRDTGFDEGISKVAEDLLRTYAANRKKADPLLAIPTRQQAVAMTLARIVRVTFPDWTIWSLPSTAHEFWHVVASRDLDVAVRGKLRQRTKDAADLVEERFDDCLADAFATYTMGPAYAFFATYLLLNPWKAYVGEPGYAAEHVRARAIVEMLARMDAHESEMEAPYADVRQTLTEAWSAALTQIGLAPEPADKAAVDADCARVTVLVDALWDALVDSAFPLFTVDIWNEVEDWVEPLIENRVGDVKVPQGAELRHVLNAAWRARVDPRRKHDITEAANLLKKTVAPALA